VPARSLVLPGVVGIHLVEAVEDRGQLGLRMPRPVSLTEICTSSTVTVASTVTMPPGAVNFKALPTRLTRAWVTRSPSQTTRAATGETSMCTPESLAMGQSDSTTSVQQRLQVLGDRVEPERAALQPLEVDDLVDQPREPFAASGGHLHHRLGLRWQLCHVPVGRHLQRPSDRRRQTSVTLTFVARSRACARSTRRCVKYAAGVTPYDAPKSRWKWYLLSPAARAIISRPNGSA
jgi:hypothetical protein